MEPFLFDLLMKSKRGDNSFRLELLNYKHLNFFLVLFVLVGFIVLDMLSVNLYSLAFLALITVLFYVLLRRSLGFRGEAIVHADHVVLNLKPNLLSRKTQKIVIDFKLVREWEFYSFNKLSYHCLKINVDKVGKIKHYFRDNLWGTDNYEFKSAFEDSIRRYSKKVIKSNKTEVIEFVNPKIEQVHPVDLQVAKWTPQKAKIHTIISIILFPLIFCLFFIAPEKKFPGVIVALIINLGYYLGVRKSK